MQQTHRRRFPEPDDRYASASADIDAGEKSIAHKTRRKGTWTSAATCDPGTTSVGRSI
jgi:hypothetical protein